MVQATDAVPRFSRQQFHKMLTVGRRLELIEAPYLAPGESSPRAVVSTYTSGVVMQDPTTGEESFLPLETGSYVETPQDGVYRVVKAPGGVAVTYRVLDGD